MHCSYQISLRPDGTTDSIDCTVYVNGCDWHQGLKNITKKSPIRNIFISGFSKSIASRSQMECPVHS